MVADEARREAKLMIDGCMVIDHVHFSDLAWLCGFFHDLGKSTSAFQKHINEDESTNDNKVLEKHHNIAGAILFNKFVEIETSEKNPPSR